MFTMKIISSLTTFVLTPDSERVVTKFTKSNQRGEGNKKGVGPNENECEESGWHCGQRKLPISACFFYSLK